MNIKTGHENKFLKHCLSYDKHNQKLLKKIQHADETLLNFQAKQVIK